MNLARLALALLLLAFTPLVAFGADHCIDAFASKAFLTAEELWMERPFKPGTQFEPLSRAISEDLHKEIVETTNQLIAQCGKDCLLVGIGRSPTVLVAQAQIQRQAAINFPISQFRALPGFSETSEAPAFPAPYDSSEIAQSFHELSAQHEKILFEHFEAFIGSRLKGTKRILLVDFSQSGASLFAVQAYMNKWLASRSGAPEVHSVNIGERTYDQISESMRKVWNVESSRISKPIGSTLMFELNNARFDKWAEFTSYNIGGKYSENHGDRYSSQGLPYFQLRNTLAIMNLARTNDPKQIPPGTKLPDAVFWDLSTKTPRNRKTNNPVDLGLEH